MAWADPAKRDAWYAKRKARAIAENRCDQCTHPLPPGHKGTRHAECLARHREANRRWQAKNREKTRAAIRAARKARKAAGICLNCPSRQLSIKANGKRGLFCRPCADAQAVKDRARSARYRRKKGRKVGTPHRCKRCLAAGVVATDHTTPRCTRPPPALGPGDLAPMSLEELRARPDRKDIAVHWGAA